MGDETDRRSWVLPYLTHAHKNAVHGCDHFAFSIYETADQLRNIQKIAGWARKKTICKFEIPPGCGELINDLERPESGHHNWWPSPLDYFPKAVVI